MDSSGALALGGVDGPAAPIPLGFASVVDAAAVALVKRYLEAVRAHDWDGLADCLSEDVVRTGPFGDTYTPRRPYVAFLAELMPTLAGYAMDVERVVASGDGAVVVAQLSETVAFDGTPIVTPETLVFDIGPDDRIARIAIYIQRLP